MFKLVVALLFATTLSFGQKLEGKYFLLPNMVGETHYHPVMIPVSYLLGKETEITVKLRPTVLGYIYPKKVVYDIKFASNNEVVLTDAKKRKIVYKRAN